MELKTADEELLRQSSDYIDDEKEAYDGTYFRFVYANEIFITECCATSVIDGIAFKGIPDYIVRLKIYGNFYDAEEITIYKVIHPFIKDELQKAISAAEKEIDAEIELSFSKK